MNHNGAPRMVAERKAIRAMQLRASGMTYDQIAASLLPCDDHRPEGSHTCERCLPMYGNRSSAKRAVDKMLEREYAAASDTREQLRRHQLSQIDLLLTRKMGEALGRGDTSNEAARVVVRLLDRRAKLLGLDAPSRVQITTELDNEIEQLVEELARAEHAAQTAP